MFDTVLVCVDEDSHLSHVAGLAGRLVQERGGTVVLFHVVRPPPTYALQAGLHLPSGELQRAATEHGHEVLRRAEAELPAGVDCRLKTKYAEHSVWREIVTAAEREQADLIVMGAHSQGAIPRPVLGSTAEKVARHVTVPVMLVR
jgi:nucleotide-binding universal stress UspA family protein